ncbi:MAG: SRPBCC domain-containing protein [Burkholderiales bacterium]|nr:SRPBCC domain-containing protein [Burkholderiales bacterium]
MTDPARSKLLPFSVSWPLAGGVLLGLVLRLVFNEGPEAMGGRSLTGLYAMAGSFVYLAPFAVGALTGWLAERRQRRSLLRHFGAGAVANVLVVLATLVIQIEGLICAILIVPLFVLIGGFGAVAMALVCHARRRSGPPMAALAVLPMLVAPVEAPLELPDDFGHVTAERLIAAPPETVWSQLMDTSAIRPEEMADGWMYRIGVPLPLFGVVERQGPLLVRHIEMGKGIRFDQIASHWDEAREVRWTYRFAADSFPPGALDDHVRVGGRHFDLLDTVYTMEPHGRQTLLRVSMRYRVSTRFNWYAEPLARGLIGNFEEVALRLYARRAEGGAG